MRPQSKLAWLVPASCAIAVVLVSGCGDQTVTGSSALHPAPSSGAASATPVASPTRIVADQHDVLQPPSSGARPKLSAEQVRQLLIASGNQAAAAYLESTDGLRVSLGTYTNQDLRDEAGQQIQNMLSYVFTSSGNCPPPVGGVQQSSPPGSPPSQGETGRCSAVVIANADTGELLEIITSPA